MVGICIWISRRFLEYSCWCWACPIDSTSIIVIRFFLKSIFKFFFGWFFAGFFVVVWCCTVVVYVWFVCRTNFSFLISSSAMEHIYFLKEYVCLTFLHSFCHSFSKFIILLCFFFHSMCVCVFVCLFYGILKWNYENHIDEENHTQNTSTSSLSES